MRTVNPPPAGQNPDPVPGTSKQPPVSRPPPPPTGRPATSSDIDRIMASIGALTGKFDTIKTDIGNRLDDHTTRLQSLAREATADRADIVDLARVIDERTDELSQTLTETRRGLPELIKNAVDERFAEINGQPQAGVSHQAPAFRTLSDTKEDRYLLARRSIHVWPLENASPQSLALFAARFLNLSKEEFAVFEIVSIVKCRHPPQSQLQNEYSVEFATVNERDLFRSYAPRLQQHQRSAGMRLALPDFLVSHFKTLEHEAFRIAQRKPGTKRNIKFEDATRSVVLDIKLPDSAWVRITYEDVVQAKGSRRKERVPAVQEVLAIGGMDLPVVPGRSNDPEMSDADMMGDEAAGEEA